ncbi:MAG: hypothetical protein WCK90_01995 [archaeon]
MTDKTIEPLVNMIKSFQDNLKRNHLPALIREVNDIITRKEKDPRIIEPYLDSLLGIVQMGLGEKEFHRLNKYYRTIHPRNARAYDRFYKEDMK